MVYVRWEHLLYSPDVTVTGLVSRVNSLIKTMVMLYFVYIARCVHVNLEEDYMYSWLATSKWTDLRRQRIKAGTVAVKSCEYRQLLPAAWVTTGGHAEVISILGRQEVLHRFYISYLITTSSLYKVRRDVVWCRKNQNLKEIKRYIGPYNCLFLSVSQICSLFQSQRDLGWRLREESAYLNIKL